MKLEKRSSFGWGSPPVPSAHLDHGIVVHYDGSDLGLAAKPHSACRSYWKNTRSFHMRTRGWSEIGYSYGCCPHGVIMEGRGWNRATAAQPGGNTTWTSCTFMTGEDEKPTAAQVAAFVEFRAWARRRGVTAAIKGHRDFVPTSCPGPILYRMVKDGSLAKGSAGPKAGDWMEELMRKLPTLKLGDEGEDVQTLQGLLAARSHPEVRMTGRFDAVTRKAVKAVQRWGDVDDDGIVGQQTWPVLLRVHN